MPTGRAPGQQLVGRTLSSQDDMIAQLLYQLGFTRINNVNDFVPGTESDKPVLGLGNFNYKGPRGFDRAEMLRRLEAVGLGGLQRNPDGPKMLVSSNQQKQGIEQGNKMSWLDFMQPARQATPMQPALNQTNQDMNAANEPVVAQADQLAQFLQILKLFSSLGGGLGGLTKR